MADAGWLASLPGGIGNAVADLPDLAVAALAAMTGALIGIAALRRSVRKPTDNLSALDLTDGCVFLFRGLDGRAANEAAQHFLARIGGDGTPWHRLSAWLERQDGSLTGRLRAMLDGGEPFMIEIAAEDGRHYELRASLRGALTVVSLRDCSEPRRRELLAVERLQRLEAESAAQAALLDAVPVPMWRTQPGRGVVWSNEAYRVLAGARPLGDTLPVLFSAPSDISLSPGARDRPRRIGLPGRDGEQHWYEVTERDLGEAGTGGCAVSADPAVRAEAALKRFVETLTETFAHLPTGLAVFDKNRRLGLFNPAMADILKLDPAWLASRPSLREFLERLRENRQMPDQPDFMAWRSKLTALERDAEEAAYEEDWVLPSGQTLHVSGRPHPQGAIAFLFEDISSAITLERRYRAEIETLRAVLHKLPEAVALFRPDGTLAHANTAFRGVWGFEAGLDVPAPHISRLIERWAAACEPGPVWRRLHDFVTGQEARSPWTARLLLLDGRILQARFSPLPDGSTLASFCDETERERLQADLREAVADLETERSLLMDRLSDMRGRIAEARALRPDAAPQGIGSLLDRLGAMLDALPARATDSEALSGTEPPGLPVDELPALVHAAARLSPAGADLVTDIDIDTVLPGLSRRRLRQLLHGLLTEAEAQRGSDGPLRLTLSYRDGTLDLSARVPGDGDPAPGLSAAILRRLARLEGGSLVMDTDERGRERTVRCTIPLEARAGAALPAQPETGG